MRLFCNFPKRLVFEHFSESRIRIINRDPLRGRFQNEVFAGQDFFDSHEISYP
jgi:hypothetical protein